MASVKESSWDHSSVGFDDDDIRGDGKKKKFKPLSAMRKFFGKRRKKEDSVVTVKAQSTTALHSNYGDDGDDEEDDGGFKNHQKPKSLAGNRSISEDSVFSPEQRETISPFPKSAVSEESLPKSAFQSELLSKLNKRRSQYSDDDHDDGLPRSPVPPVTTADVIMGGPLKPGTSGKKSSNRDSDQSLISVDSSENEEEDLFQSKWKSSVPAKKLAGPTSPKTSSSSSMDLDLNSVQKTELLTNSAARDKIAVKPKRGKASRQSRKKRDTSSPQSLPSLNEESPTRSQPEEVKNSWTSGSPIAKASEITLSSKPPEDKVPTTTTSTSSGRAPLSAVDNKKAGGSATKPNLSSINISSKGDKPSSSAKPASSPPATVSIAAAPVVTSAPPKVTTPTSPSTKFEPQNKSSGAQYSATQNQSASSPNISISGSTGLTTASAGLSIKETKASETVSVSEKIPEKASGTSISVNVAAVKDGPTQKGADEDKPSVDVKSRMSRFQPPSSSSSSSSKFGTSSAIPETPALKVTEPGSNVTLSPKEDYKARRQVRSRTLPGVTDEQSSPKVQRSSSHRIQTTTGSPETPEEAGPPEPEKTTSLVPAASSTSSSTSGVKKLSNMKFASVDSPSSTPSEPAWKNMMRKKQEDQGTNVEADDSKGPASTSDKTTTEVTALKSGASTSTAKSAVTPVSYLDKKRGSVETVSYKGRDVSDQSSKKADTLSSETKQPSAEMSPAKRPSVDMSPSKRPSIDITSTKRESIEIDISELNSVRALRSSFAPGTKGDSSSKSGSLKDSKPNVPSAASTTSAVGSDNLKPSAAASGISPFRGGSVKTAPSATVEIKSTFPARGGSVKGPSSLSSTPGSNLPSAAATIPSSTTSSPTSSSSVLTKIAESGSATNSSNSGSSSASSSSSAPTPSSVHASQPNTSLPSHTAAKSESSSSGGTNIQTDKSSNRSSKVLDMVKNFQNLQVS